MLTAVCVLRSGGCYTAEYVEKLRAGVARHLTMEHRFVCLSDVDVPCERIPLAHNWPGWWSKMELFQLPPPVLYADLDTIIVDSLTDAARAAQSHPLILLRDFYREKGFGSGLMGWASDQRPLYDKFAADPRGWMGRLGGRGDQGFLEETVARSAVHLWQDILPGQIVSYKVHVRQSDRRGETGTGDVPPNARVVCFHGKPKPHEVPALWA